MANRDFSTANDDDTTWRETDRRIRALGPRRASLDAEEAELIALAEKHELHHRMGFVSLLAYFEDALGHTPKTANDRLRLAKRLARLPEIAKALADGTIHNSAARELARVATGETEAAWLAAADGKSLREIEKLVTGHTLGSMPDDAPGEDIHERPVTLELSPQTVALFREIRKLLTDECGEYLSDDAVIDLLCRQTLDGGSVESNRPTHQIATTICEKCDRAWHDGAGAVVEIDKAAIALSRCDAEHIGSLDAEEPARAKSDIPPSVRRLIHRRDHGACSVPGCRSTRFLHIHHLIARADGGDHTPSLLLLLCGHHHRELHAGRLSITGSAPDALVIKKLTMSTRSTDEHLEPHVGRIRYASNDPEEEAAAIERLTATIREWEATAMKR